MDVASIMSSEPLSVALDTPVQDARNLMDNEDIRHLPVLAGDRLVAVISDRDLYPTEDELAAARDGAPARTIADILHAKLTTVSPDDTVVTAAAQCLVQKNGCLPVMRGTKLVGVLSEMDLLMAFTQSWREGELADAGRQPSVDDLMTPFPLAATPQTTVTEAIGMCHSLRGRHLPVVAGDTLVGIVSDRDLRRSVAAGRAHETTLNTIMEHDPLTIGPRHPSAEAAALMVTAKVSALPVVDGEQLVGILTLTDLIEHFMNVLSDAESNVA